MEIEQPLHFLLRRGFTADWIRKDDATYRQIREEDACLAEIEERKRLREHKDILTRGEAKNILRDQNKSLLLLFILIATTGFLVWWGLKLMQG